MSSKITIIGAGSVGSTIAYTLSSQDIASEIDSDRYQQKERQKVKFWILSREPASEILSLSLPETTKMLGILTSLSSHPVLPINQDRQDLNLHRQM